MMIKKINRFSYLIEKIKHELKYRDIDLAEYLNVTPATISNWVNSNALPRGKNINKIAKILCKELEMRNILSVSYCYECIAELTNNYSLPEEQIQKIKHLVSVNKFKEAIASLFSLIYEEDVNNKASKGMVEAEKMGPYSVNAYCKSIIAGREEGNIELLARYVAKVLLQNKIFQDNNMIETDPRIFKEYVM